MQDRAFLPQRGSQLLHNCWARLLLGWGEQKEKAQGTRQWQLLLQGVQGTEPPSFHSSHCPPHLQQEQQRFTSRNWAAERRSCSSCFTFTNNPSLAPSKKKKGIQGKRINPAPSNSFLTSRLNEVPPCFKLSLCSFTASGVVQHCMYLKT